jgi:hypothetical protein
MAERLRELKSKSELTEDELAQIERDIFIGFYSVRKLLDAQTKITDATKNSKIRLSWHPNIKPTRLLPKSDPDQVYDFDAGGQEERDIIFVCGRIIHSFFFIPGVSEKGGLEGILFTSDTDKDKRIYYCAIDEIIMLFERVGNDQVQRMMYSHDLETGRTIIILE